MASRAQHNLVGVVDGAACRKRRTVGDDDMAAVDAVAVLWAAVNVLLPVMASVTPAPAQSRAPYCRRAN
jgi:hypothetical protein